MTKPRQTYRVSLFTRLFDRAEFSCGQPELDRYLKVQATQDVRRQVSRLFILHEADQHRIAGFYTLGAASIAFRKLPANIAKKLPRYPIPAVLIGRLAVDRLCQGRGLGKVLLADALKRILTVSETVAIHAVLVDAKDESARRFYEKFGFVPFKDEPMKLFIPLKTIASLSK